ncbi:MAG TPA: hypothetical protein VFH61_03820, partial [Thermoleophilia bacterium]|nr:hypothetical protein [Thermoleophilia bacterium]
IVKLTGTHSVGSGQSERFITELSSILLPGMPPDGNRWWRIRACVDFNGTIGEDGSVRVRIGPTGASSGDTQYYREYTGASGFYTGTNDRFPIPIGSGGDAAHSSSTTTYHSSVNTLEFDSLYTTLGSAFSAGLKVQPAVGDRYLSISWQEDNNPDAWDAIVPSFVEIEYIG